MTTISKHPEETTATNTDSFSYSSSSSSSSSGRSTTDGGIVFSSTKCPPEGSNGNQVGRRLEQTCELPFGFCYTPMIRLSPQISSSAEPSELPNGVICSTCLAYMNLYCTTSEKQLETGSIKQATIWTCALCQSDNVFSNDKDIGSAIEDRNCSIEKFISQRVVEFRQSLSVKAGKASLPMKTVIIVIDENLPVMETQSIAAAVRGILEHNLQERGFHWQLGLIVFGETISIFQLGVSSGIVIADKVRSYEGFLIMTEVDSGCDLAHRAYLGTSIDGLIMCLTAAFDLKLNLSNSNDVLPGNPSDGNLPKKTRLDILKERKMARMNQSSEIAKSKLQDNDGSSSPWTKSREQLARSRPPFRRTGDALQCAIDLATLQTNAIGGFESSFQSTDINNGRKSSLHDRRILLFTNGCPNLGDGSVINNDGDAGIGMAVYSTVDSSRLPQACEYFEVIGKISVDVGVGIDVFCTGSSELGFPTYQSLVEPSSGYVLSHDTFASSRFQSNISYVLEQTQMSRSYFREQGVDSDEEKHELQAVDGTCINGCIVDIRMSSFLTSTHLIGPGDLIETPSGPLINEREMFENGLTMNEDCELMGDKEYPFSDLLDSTLTRIRIGRYDPLSTYSVMLRLNDLYQGEDYAFFQFIVRFVDFTDNVLVTRVASHRLSVANDVGEFLEAIDETVVPVLLGKEAVYRSMFGRDVNVDHPFHSAYIDELQNLALDAQRDLDNTIFRISGAYRLLSLVQGTKSIDLTEKGGMKAPGSSMDFAFPPELSDALRRLYHLRRGPLLSPGPIQSADHRAEMRSLFVRFPCDDCLGMMAPSMWSSGESEEEPSNRELQFHSVPPETLALWQNSVIMADHWYNMFVWSGSETLKPEFDRIRTQFELFLRTRARGRFPSPNLYIISEADSMSRRFISILGPSHGDPVEHQLAHFHDLSVLSTIELARLQSRFRFYDPETDPSFRKWFWDVASAASTCGAEGISLCD